MKKFKKVYVEITNVCNLECNFCPKTSREPEFMNIESFKYILDEIKPFSDYIYLHVKGEPLLHPELDKILDASYAKKFHVHITTNGILIKDLKDKILLKPGLRQINFSLHDFDSNDAWNQNEYVYNIIEFVKEALDKTDMFISLRLWNLDKHCGNAHSQKNRSILALFEKEFGLSYHIEDKFVPDKGIKITDKLYVNFDYEFSWPDINESRENAKGFCLGLREHAAILVDGAVVPCCLDGEGDIRLGNIFEQKFSDIIRGQRAATIYEGFSNQNAVEPLCKKCTYKDKFK